MRPRTICDNCPESGLQSLQLCPQFVGRQQINSLEELNTPPGSDSQPGISRRRSANCGSPYHLQTLITDCLQHLLGLVCRPISPSRITACHS
jgi:hypothetical protein